MAHIPPPPNGISPWAEELPPADDNSAEERVVRSGAPDVRGDYSVRQDAERADMPNMTDDELEAMIMAEYESSGVSNPPTLPGFHLCWLTTTSQFDTLQRRQRVGYMGVMRSEMPGYDPSMGNALAGYEGLVTCNEMILHKIAERRYQILMNMYHHKHPLQSEEAIIKFIKEQANAKVDNSGGDDAAGLTVLERSVKVGSSLPEQRFY
jgi:hypothetical protein